MQISDLRAVPDAVIDQVADRFGDLPRPVLAAIGAGDLALEQLVALRESLVEQLSDPAKRPDPAEVAGAVNASVATLQAKVQQTATGYVAKAQQAVGDYAQKAQLAISEYPGKLQQAATEFPAKAQQTLAELPDKAGQLVASGGELQQRAAQIATDVAEE
ncbi:MAG TPA: hypothetical protein PKY70_12420, partial [Nakamurella multipartita]|nr:hypothetical protein [Nakamurella multipartita]